MDLIVFETEAPRSVSTTSRVTIVPFGGDVFAGYGKKQFYCLHASYRDTAKGIGLSCSSRITKVSGEFSTRKVDNNTWVRAAQVMHRNIELGGLTRLDGVCGRSDTVCKSRGAINDARVTRPRNVSAAIA